ncbi:MAG: vWA domain-containing protein [Polyangiaceae bacterium]
MKHLISIATCVLLSICATSCSKSSGDDKGSENGGTAGSSASGVGGGGDTNGPPGQPPPAAFVKSESGKCELAVAEETCAASAFESETIPLDIHLMIDRSGSMCNCVDPVISNGACPDPNCRKTRMDAIVEALEAFVASQSSNGLGIGVGYFGQQPIGSADCRESTYSQPSVAIDVLPSNAQAVSASLKKEATPIGETPTGAAIRGACTYAQAWKKAHPAHQTVILFVTDGEPKAPVSCPSGVGAACCPTLDDAVTAASDCAGGNPAIRTYVLGVGPFLSNLGRIAEAGGTNRAYLVESGDVTSQVLSALNAIRGDAAIPCEFPIPEAPGGSSLDLGRIGIAYADAQCKSKVFYRVESPTDCGDGDGWYFDDPTNPSQVRLCSSSCSYVSSNGGSLFYSVGCGWEVPIQ